MQANDVPGGATMLAFCSLGCFAHVVTLPDFAAVQFNRKEKEHKGLLFENLTPPFFAFFALFAVK
ncbi:MAG: hypothetical protein NT049_14770 [Planctomycetota bacterium]|nr:hypothetical protein [Planctomycetota bacterium]